MGASWTSLMTLNVQKPVSFIENTQIIVDHKTLKRAVLWWAQGKPVQKEKSIFQHGRYPGVSIHGDKLHVHRLLMSYKVRRRLTFHENVHHKNGTKHDARMSNLAIVAAGRHQSDHLKGTRQDPDFVKRRIAASIKRRWPIYEHPSLLTKDN